MAGHHSVAALLRPCALKEEGVSGMVSEPKPVGDVKPRRPHLDLGRDSKCARTYPRLADALSEVRHAGPSSCAVDESRRGEVPPVSHPLARGNPELRTEGSGEAVPSLWRSVLSSESSKSPTWAIRCRGCSPPPHSVWTLPTRWRVLSPNVASTLVALGIEKAVERSALHGAVTTGADLGVDAHSHAGVAVTDLLHDVGD